MTAEWNSIRLSGHAHRIVTKTVNSTLPWSLYCLFKTGPCAVILVRSLPNLQDK